MRENGGVAGNTIPNPIKKEEEKVYQLPSSRMYVELLAGKTLFGASTAEDL